MDYRIVAAHASGQIEVAYMHEGEVVAVYAVDVPVVDGRFISGQELDAEIRSRSPEWLVARKGEVQSASGFEQIEALVQPLPAPAVDPQDAANAAMWSEVRIEQEVAKALVKFGVLESDPTAIPVEVL